MLNVLLLDSDGKRVAVKYYDQKMKTLAQQMVEKEVFTKTQRNNARGEAEIAPSTTTSSRPSSARTCTSSSPRTWTRTRSSSPPC